MTHEEVARHDERIKNIESQTPKIWEEIAELRKENSENWKHFFESQQSIKIQVAAISGSVAIVVAIVVRFLGGQH